jgi:6-phosphogluconolactonase
MAQLTVAADPERLASTAAERVTSLIETSLASRGEAVVGLTGGETPLRLYELLADPHYPWRTRIHWRRLHLFWSDERHVPPDHPDSNFGLAERALLRHVQVPADQIHRIRAEMPEAAAAAREYEERLRGAFAAAGRADQHADVLLLGMGEDAHIASIFPDSSLLPKNNGGTADTSRVAAVWVERLGVWRITMTPAALLDSHAIAVVVSGESKADAVRAAVDLPVDVQRYPAQLLRAAADRVEWLIDAAAARRLSARRAPPSSPTQ